MKKEKTTPNKNDFKFHFEYFSRNTQFLSFDGPTSYLYLFKNHRQTFSWLGECPSSHLIITNMWSCSNIKYLSKSFFANFFCREGISWFFMNLLLTDLIQTWGCLCCIFTLQHITISRRRCRWFWCIFYFLMVLKILSGSNGIRTHNHLVECSFTN